MLYIRHSKHRSSFSACEHCKKCNVLLPCCQLAIYFAVRGLFLCNFSGGCCTLWAFMCDCKGLAETIYIFFRATIPGTLASAVHIMPPDLDERSEISLLLFLDSKCDLHLPTCHSNVARNSSLFLLIHSSEALLCHRSAWY